MNFKGYEKFLSADISQLREKVNSDLYKYQLDIRESIDHELLEYFSIKHGICAFGNIEGFINQNKEHFTVRISRGYGEHKETTVETYSYKGTIILEVHINLYGSTIYPVWKGD